INSSIKKEKEKKILTNGLRILAQIIAREIAGKDSDKEGELKSSEVKEYVSDLKNLLSNGTIIEQKSFIKSFIKRIEINLPKVMIDYTVPLKIKKAEHLTKEVLPLELFGRRNRT
ncbi:unnamed protein product, partial [marine sediment metagenome]